MSAERNALGQPLGAAVPGWTPPPVPPRETLVGRGCRLEPLDPERHAADLHAASREDTDGRTWTYLPYGPFGSVEAHRAWLAEVSGLDDPIFFAIVPSDDGRAAGVASYLRIQPEAGSIEVGHLYFAPRLARATAATEAMVLMMRRAFALGYRRYEWKCHALNAASRGAAQRLGFSFEGVFRQARVDRGRNRDTAWYSVIDGEWPRLEEAFERWLDPANFDAQGRQRTRLSDATGPLLARRG